jgi:NAD(P)H dehydrogenase (quinone)
VAQRAISGALESRTASPSRSTEGGGVIRTSRRVTHQEKGRSMHALVVSAHPRTNSLTAATSRRAADRLTAAGYTVDLLDLYAEGFDPALHPVDEPDWTDASKEYSHEVKSHMARVAAADLIIVIFPVWWFSLPAMAKGWVDRVLNRGFAYEPSTLSGKRMVWIGLAGGAAADYAASGFDELLVRQLRVGVAEVCGITDATVHLVHNTHDEPRPEAVDELLASARVAA